jgi:hypothetical protein
LSPLGIGNISQCWLSWFQSENSQSDKSISTLGYFLIYFSIKPLIFKTFSWSHSLSNFNKIFSIKCKINVVHSSYNLHIILFLLFLRTWNKHKLWFFSHQIWLYNHRKLWRWELIVSPSKWTVCHCSLQSFT